MNYRSPERIKAAHDELLRLLLAYDRRQCDREMRAFGGTGLADVYRASHFTKASRGVTERVVAGEPWMFSLCKTFGRRAGKDFDLPPVRAFVRWLVKAGWVCC